MLMLTPSPKPSKISYPYCAARIVVSLGSVDIRPYSYLKSTFRNQTLPKNTFEH